MITAVGYFVSSAASVSVSSVSSCPYAPIWNSCCSPEVVTWTPFSSSFRSFTYMVLVVWGSVARSISMGSNRCAGSACNVLRTTLLQRYLYLVLIQIYNRNGSRYDFTGTRAWKSRAIYFFVRGSKSIFFTRTSTFFPSSSR